MGSPRPHRRPCRLPTPLPPLSPSRTPAPTPEPYPGADPGTFGDAPGADARTFPSNPLTSRSPVDRGAPPSPEHAPDRSPPPALRLPRADEYEALLGHVAAHADARSRARSSTPTPSPRRTTTSSAARASIPTSSGSGRRSRIAASWAAPAPASRARGPPLRARIDRAPAHPARRRRLLHATPRREQPGTDRCRMITFVYYFNAEPRPFEGGQLRLYDTDRGRPRRTAPGRRVHRDRARSPTASCSSRRTPYHEVVPVRALGDGPGAIRCTVNGWYRAGDLGRPSLPPGGPGRADPARRPRALPRVGDRGFGVRPTPEPIHRAPRVALGVGPGRDPTRGGSSPPTSPTATRTSSRWARSATRSSTGSPRCTRSGPASPLRPVAAYGMRIYRAGQRAVMHIERPETHVVSSMLVVAQDVDAPWPFQLDLAERRHDALRPAGSDAPLRRGVVPPRPPRSVWRVAHYVVVLVHYRPLDWPHSTESHRPAGARGRSHRRRGTRPAPCCAPTPPGRRRVERTPPDRPRDARRRPRAVSPVDRHPSHRSVIPGS